MSSQTHTLPPLPYAYDALEPVISKQIMELHHQKHHQTYINNLNAALSAQASEAIASRWGSLEAFVKAFGAELLGLQGSGWGWLVSKGGAKGRLEIITTKDQDPVNAPDVPVFGVDMWEHAYYLQYLNNKAGYVEGIWKIIHWAEAEKRYTAGVENPLKL
ncbi:hypothetical protein CBS147326_7210 [Penicillium roqueforti]|nr:hypothetical protein CBS147326_7210 [Penicillium roqueforti]